MMQLVVPCKFCNGFIYRSVIIFGNAPIPRHQRWKTSWHILRLNIINSFDFGRPE